jgi:hypothetical protein
MQRYCLWGVKFKSGSSVHTLGDSDLSLHGSGAHRQSGQSHNSDLQMGIYQCQCHCGGLGREDAA